MTVLEFISALISTISLVVVAVIDQKGNKRQKKSDRQAELRRQESLLNMRLTAANSELCEVICIAVTGGHTNGNVEAARQKVKAAKEDYQKFLEETSTSALED